MSTTPSLFSRAHPGKKAPPKKVRGFMSLPGEIRNIIYAYHFFASVRCEFVAPACKFNRPERRTVKLWPGHYHAKENQKPFKYVAKEDPSGPVTIRYPRLLGKYNVVEGLQTDWLASLFALNLVCKQVYMETTAFLYQGTFFVFNAPKRINVFLTVVPKEKLNLITKLELQYDTYGLPLMCRDSVWQEKHHESWFKACKALSKNLVALKVLKVWVRVHDSAPKFNLREKWVAPLLQFRRLTCQPKSVLDTADSPQQHLQGLTDVYIYVLTRWSDDPLQAYEGHTSLVKASRHLHLLFGKAIISAILGAKEEEAMAPFCKAWEVKYAMWKQRLQFGRTER